MTTESSNQNLVNNNDISEKDSSTADNLNPSSFTNYFDQNAVLPFKSFLKENIKSFNLLPNEENSTKENELENSLKVKYNFDTPTLEIILKITSDYDVIQTKIKEYLVLFGDINSLRYDHNANSVKVNYKYYFSCLYANRSLTNILQNQNEINSAINYYSNCDFSNKSINTISKDNFNKNSSNKDFSQAFKFLTENYKTNTKFKTHIYRDEKNDNSSENIINAEDSFNNIVTENKTNIEELTNNDKDYMNTPKLNPSNKKINLNIDTNSYNNMKTKFRKNNSNNKSSGYRKKLYNSYVNPMNNMLFPQNLFYQYLSMNNPNTLKIPVPIPVPVPVPMPITSPKLNKNLSYNSNKAINNSNSFSKTKIKSSFLNQTKEKEKENTPIRLNQTKMQTESNTNINESPLMAPINNSNSNNIINIFYDSNIAKIHESPKCISKSNEKILEKGQTNNNINEDKETMSDKENNSSSCNASGKSSQKNNEMVSSIKFTDKNNLEFLSTMDQKRLSLDRLNYFLQNNKPISNFNNPIKNLKQDENEYRQGFNKKMLFPFFLPFPMQPPFKFPKNNQFFFPGGFNKNIIDFDKLTLNTRNTIRFETYSSRDYYYKYVCNYLIQIENDDNFLITKRIIGKNGCFLKKIIQEACIKYGDFSTKIRLRGKGSGYLEQNGKESDEPLMLCVSSLNYPTYINCCLLIDSLLKKIYNDYYEYLLKIVPKELKYSVNKKKILKHEFVVNRFNSSYSYGNNKDNIKRNIKDDDNDSKDNASKDQILCNKNNEEN